MQKRQTFFTSVIRFCFQERLNDLNIRQLKEELSLSDRIYYCECGNRMDRDVNAAVNIMNEGKESLQNVHDSTIKSP